ncbi:MAG TPA: hypothetical protein VKB93_22310 [Thermoanaerobaculia bacterium]|nr:hypothetical protein [Thermoanaerobaculia bacterium]
MRKLLNFVFLAVLMLVLPAAPAAAQPLPQDVITVGSGSGPAGTVVDIPVYIRDTSGTPLGIDQPAGMRIQSWSIKVDYSPTSPIQSITFTRAGITAGLTPAFESSPAVPGSISLIDTFAENTNLVPFTSNAALPGNQVAHLLVTLSGTATPGQIITLNLDPILTQLANQAGTTTETVGAGNLLLVNGTLTVTQAGGAPTLSTWAMIVLAVTLAFVAIRFRT